MEISFAMWGGQEDEQWPAGRLAGGNHPYARCPGVQSAHLQGYYIRTIFTAQYYLKTLHRYGERAGKRLALLGSNK